jgi:hypothetical protein
VRIPQLYPGKRHSKNKGQIAGQPSGNPLGKNPSDYWEFSPNQIFRQDPVWDIPNVKANHPEKTIHPSAIPSFFEIKESAWGRAFTKRLGAGDFFKLRWLRY